jgi:hypothetical protein
MISPEVLIYVQNLKKYFETNVEAHNHFLEGIDENLFFKLLTEISEKNFNKNGNAMLEKTQFELLRKTLRAISESKNPIDYTKKEEKIFNNYGNFGDFCLN